MVLQMIQNKIYEIRGRRVMLDFDLAEIYEVETKRLKEQVRRNIARFPNDFMFELTTHEYNLLKDSIRSQFATLETIDGRGKYPKYASFAFTEQGVAMLSSVLHSEKAIQANINIMRTFVKIRELTMHAIEVTQLVRDHADLRSLMEQFIEETEDKFDDVYIALAKLAMQKELPPAPRPKIGFKRQDEKV